MVVRPATCAVDTTGLGQASGGTGAQGCESSSVGLNVKDPRAGFFGEGGRGGELMRLMSLAPNEETFGSPAPTKRGEAVEVPDRRSPL